MREVREVDDCDGEIDDGSVGGDVRGTNHHVAAADVGPERNPARRTISQNGIKWICRR